MNFDCVMIEKLYICLAGQETWHSLPNFVSQVHYTRLMAAQQFEFSKERDGLSMAVADAKKKEKSFVAERNNLLEDMHSLASDVQHLEEQLVKAEEDLKQALYYIQENDQSVCSADGSVLHQQLRNALKAKDAALVAVEKAAGKHETAQAEHEIQIQHLEEELRIYKEAAPASVWNLKSVEENSHRAEVKRKTDFGHILDLGETASRSLHRQTHPSLKRDDSFHSVSADVA
jgi:chromosome segregation ATPase